MSTTWRPLSEVKDDLSVKWYRTKLEPEVLRGLLARSNLKGLAQSLGHLLLYLATGTLSFWLWYRQIWVGFAAAALVHGAVTRFLWAGVHELIHGTVFRTKWLNKPFLNIFSILSWFNHVDYAASHTYHHIYTLYRDADRENLLPLSPAPGVIGWIRVCILNMSGRAGSSFASGGFISTVLLCFRIAFGFRPRSSAPSIEWLDALHKEHPKEARRSAWWCRFALLFHGAVVAVSIVTGLWVLPIIVTLAAFIGNIGLFAVGLPQHCGLKDNNPDFRKSTRSIKLGPVLTFLYWYMNWHLGHHMYAAVPCYNLRKLSRVIADDTPVPKSMFGAWKEMREIWRRQQSDPSYQYEVPLPGTATPWPAPAGAGTSRSDAVADATDAASSVDEMAPDDLL